MLTLVDALIRLTSLLLASIASCLPQTALPENRLSSLLNNLNDLPVVDPTMEHSVAVRSKSVKSGRGCPKQNKGSLLTFIGGNCKFEHAKRVDEVNNYGKGPLEGRIQDGLLRTIHIECAKSCSRRCKRDDYLLGLCSITLSGLMATQLIWFVFCRL